MTADSSSFKLISLILSICIVDIWRSANLKPLVGIADHGTFSGAAEVLGTVQSNISTRIARLETELGTELVNRSSGCLTESGEIVLCDRAKDLGELAAIASDVSELNAEIHGQVSSA
jgi:DNA-binding transcriptional LysR family regulator